MEPVDSPPDRVERLFHAALEVEPGSREAFLTETCGGDGALRRVVRRLLDAAGRAAVNTAWSEPAIRNESRFAAADIHSECDTMLDRYRLIERIGFGGMGRVYKAVRADDEYSKLVAIKIVQPGAGENGNEQIVRRFRQERQILAGLEHPNIARLLDGGSTPEGLPFLVMEYVDGIPIDRYLAERKAPQREKLQLFREVCSAVSYAHRNLVVHKDLKPGNILVNADGVPKLLDFGIAKLLDQSAARTQTGAGAMTPEYASPEQLRGAPITTGTDVYSLGVLLYELLGEVRLYRDALYRDGRGAMELAQAICIEFPETLSARTGRRFDADLENIVKMALRKEPERRYASVERFSDDIRRYLEGYPVAARPATRQYRARKFIGRNKVSIAAATVVLLTLVSAIVTTAREAQIAGRRFNDVRKLAHSVLFDYHDAIAALPGSTPARAMLVADALGYLDVMARESGGDTPLQLELASAYVRMGDVQGRPYAPNLGQTDGALASYRKALAILEGMVAKDPNGREARRQLATGLERVGNIELRKGQYAESAASHRKALLIRERLLALNPSGAGFRQDLAASYLYLGDVLQVGCFVPPQLACLQNAFGYQQKALAMRLELSRANPKDLQLRRELAQAYMRVGFRLRDIAFMTNDMAFMRQALESHRLGLQTMEEVAAASVSSARDRRDAADQRFVMSPVQAALGDYAGALAGYRQTVETFQSLATADPANTEARRDLSFSYQKLAQMLNDRGDLAEAGRYYEAGLAASRRLLADDPGSDEDRRNISGIYSGMSMLAEKQGDFVRAAEDYGNGAADAPSGQAYLHIERLYIEAAQAARISATERTKDWRAARDAARRTIEFIQAQDAPEGKSPLLAFAIEDLALCDATLAKAR